MCPPFRAAWQMVTRPCITFPLPSLKFRTAGFPQYGFKPNRPVATFVSGPRPAAYRRPAGPSFCPCSPCGQSAVTGSVRGVCRTSSVQRPFARRRVILSRQLKRYYGLIRASGVRPPAYCSSSGGRLGRQRVPTFICLSLVPCRLPYPGESGGVCCCLLHPW